GVFAVNLGWREDLAGSPKSGRAGGRLLAFGCLASWRRTLRAAGERRCSRGQWRGAIVMGGAGESCVIALDSMGAIF
ncbi:hypothetical protein, partial [Achromobacter xylosoxidans]|uniref:hypothetical protein n=1 Tax=Alcaligenes xylosoxydans xylosoxydans TaxID=85698 RepID=UPI001EED6448